MARMIDGLTKFSSQVPSFPAIIQLNRGNDPLGNLAGQTTMCFMYASDQGTTMTYPFPLTVNVF